MRGIDLHNHFPMQIYLLDGCTCLSVVANGWLETWSGVYLIIPKRAARTCCTSVGRHICMGEIL